MDILALVKHVRNKLLGITQQIEISEIVISNPTNESEIQGLERELSYRLPISLKEFYLNQSSMLSFFWSCDTSSFKG
jgi:hypothetical protein